MNMSNIFEVVDKSKRKIRLSPERWKHIATEHPHITHVEGIKQALMAPVKILSSDCDPQVKWYFSYQKQRKRYLKVSVKYLNSTGYVITAHYTIKIQ